MLAVASVLAMTACSQPQETAAPAEYNEVEFAQAPFGLTTDECNLGTVAAHPEQFPEQ